MAHLLPSDLVNIILTLHNEPRQGVYRELLALPEDRDLWYCNREKMVGWLRLLASEGAISYVNHRKIPIQVDEEWYTKDWVSYPVAPRMRWNPSHLVKILQAIQAILVEFEKYGQQLPIDAFQIWVHKAGDKWHYHTTRF